MVIDTTLVNVALPTLVRELDTTTRELQWVVDAYNLVFAALVLAAGSLGDRFGRRGMLVAGLLAPPSNDIFQRARGGLERSGGPRGR